MSGAAASVSVVMPLYAGAEPDHLRRALESIYLQTRLPDEVVVVEDGPLTDAHHAVLASFETRVPPLRRVVLPVNQGVGPALNAGLRDARSEWIARMDADDVAVPERLARQLAALDGGGYDVLGSAMVEFDEDEGRPLAVRPAPIEHAAIARRMRINSPMNHPTTVFRRELALAVGGYPDLRGVEDYDFFARMLVHGARMHNLADPLLLFRADAAMFDRRTAKVMTRSEFSLQQRLRSYGLFGRPRMVLNLALRLTYYRLPPRVLRLAYRLLFRRAVGR